MHGSTKLKFCCLQSSSSELNICEASACETSVLMFRTRGCFCARNPIHPASYYHCTNVTNSSCIRDWHNRTIQGCTTKSVRLKALQNAGQDSQPRVVTALNEARSTSSFCSTILQLADVTVNSRLEFQNSIALQITLLNTLPNTRGHFYLLVSVQQATKLLLCQGPKRDTTRCTVRQNEIQK